MEKLRERIQAIILEEDIVIDQICWRTENQQKILEVSIYSTTRNVDLDLCASISNQISNYLDENDICDDAYFLEVCSCGAEREIKSEQELINCVDKYLYIEFKEPIKNKQFVKGTLISYENELFLVEYMDKAVKKKVNFKYEDIAFVRYSVKI